MSMETDTPMSILIKLRTRLNDMLKSGIATPESFGLYQQTMLQLYQEFDRRRISNLEQAAQLRAQASAIESQAHAFTAATSLLFAVVNGYIELEEKRARETAEREAERLANEPQPEAPKKNKGGRPKKNKSVEPVVDAAASSPGAGSTDAPDES